MSFEGIYRFSTFWVPEINDAICCSRSKQFSIWAERNSINIAFTTNDGLYNFFLLHIPHSYRPIRRTRCESLAIEAECHRENPPSMLWKCIGYIPWFCIPQADLFIRRTSSEPMAIWTKCDGMNIAFIPFFIISFECT